MGEFIKAGRGVCRHHGLISATLIEHFIGEGYLAGRIYYFRGAGHAWSVYRTSGGIFRVFDVAQKYYGPLANARYWTGKEKLFYSDVVPREIFKQNTSSPLGEDNNVVGSTSLSTTVNDKGGIAFNALPIRTEAVASSALGPFSGFNAFKGDLDAEWAQIQQVFNAGIRPSIQRLSEYTLAVAGRGGSRTAPTEEKIDGVRGLLADILRREEEDEKLPAAEAALKNLVSALES